MLEGVSAALGGITVHAALAQRNFKVALKIRVALSAYGAVADTFDGNGFRRSCAILQRHAPAYHNSPSCRRNIGNRRARSSAGRGSGTSAGPDLRPCSSNHQKNKT